MSQINLNNPQVLANFIKTRIREGNGELVERKDVSVFVDDVYGELMVPAEMEEKAKEKAEEKEETKTKTEIKEELDAVGIEYKSSANKSELEALLKAGPQEEEEEEEEVEEDK